MIDHDKKIHIKLPDGLHRKLRTKCAYHDISIQDYVLGLVEKDLSGIEIIVQEGVSETEADQKLQNVGH